MRICHADQAGFAGRIPRPLACDSGRFTRGNLHLLMSIANPKDSETTRRPHSTVNRLRHSTNGVVMVHFDRKACETRHLYLVHFTHATQGKVSHHQWCNGLVVVRASYYTYALAGHSAVWLARLTGGQEVGGSNPLGPTLNLNSSLHGFAASCFFLGTSELRKRRRPTQSVQTGDAFQDANKGNC